MAKEWLKHLKCDPGHEKTCLMSYANNKGADKIAHRRSLISAFVVRCLDSIISLDSIAEMSRLYLASVAAQAGLCLAWSETPEDTFCRVVAHVVQKGTYMSIYSIDNVHTLIVVTWGRHAHIELSK